MLSDLHELQHPGKCSGIFAHNLMLSYPKEALRKARYNGAKERPFPMKEFLSWKGIYLRRLGNTKTKDITHSTK